MIIEVLSSAPILFFLLGIFSRAIHSDLDIPHPLPKFFSIYVLAAIGIKGGVHLANTGLQAQYIQVLGLAVGGSFLLTAVAYAIFKCFIDKPNAVALAASYGSISAVTFVTGTALLDRVGITYGPYMIAAMALMESPAILMAMILHNKKTHSKRGSTMAIIRHSLTNNSVVLLLGSFLIGFFLSKESWNKIAFFYDGIFYGMLTLFLLDLGLAVVKRFADVRRAPLKIFFAALPLQIGAALLAFGAGKLMGMSQGDTFLMMLLFGSASYIAAPAAMRTAVPEANPGLYLSLAMGITFPFNIIVGIPAYLWVVQRFGG